MKHLFLVTVITLLILSASRTQSEPYYVNVALIKIYGLNLGSIAYKPMQVFIEECKALSGELLKYKGYETLTTQTVPVFIALCQKETL